MQASKARPEDFIGSGIKQSMNAVEKMVQQGNWLFRYRSYLPIFILVFALGCMWTQRRIYTTDYFWFDIMCLLISLSGEVIRIVAVGYAANRTSGRNTKQQVASEINQTGIYSLVRHPLYIGNFFMWLGIAIYSRIWWLAVIFVLLYWIYYERIILAEEDYLSGKFGDAYRQYAEKVNGIIPDWKNYQANKYCFRAKKALRQENPSLYGMIVVFVLLKLWQGLISKCFTPYLIFWIMLGGGFSLLYVIVLILKKKTRILHGETGYQK
jgi:protein-S-isoprenylcysteine O-methyltransferase Ste14